MQINSKFNFVVFLETCIKKQLTKKYLIIVTCVYINLFLFLKNNKFTI